jgi:hypothetical protein
VLLTDGDKDKDHSEVVAAGVEADGPPCDATIVDVLVHLVPLGVQEEASHDHHPYAGNEGGHRPLHELLSLE